MTFEKQSQLVPYSLLFGGLAGALYIAWLVALDPSLEYCVSFAVCCVVAAIGYSEKVATAEFNDTFHGE
jgi:hypothetical protein